MTINGLDITINDDDLNSIISQKIPAQNKISNVYATMDTDRIVFSGTMRVLLPVNFEATFLISSTEKEIVARLEEIRPMSALADQFKGKILEKIATAAPFLHLKTENDSIHISVDALLHNNGINSDLSIKEMSVARHQLSLKLAGNITL